MKQKLNGPYIPADLMLLEGIPSSEVARRTGLRERGIRRRKGALLAAGHVIPSRTEDGRTLTQGDCPGKTKHDNTSH